ncbi:hypothetical protein Sjap_023493 [Stephania japonica]|uniref:Uncharacterized protein n=1 Tax=Stephania japonica TaxID=461633 RepID=A0AAP0HN11_9MAGN
MARETAIIQLKLMVPCIVFSGPVGLGYGRLSAEGNNFIASISPALSSISIAVSCVIYAFIRGSEKIPVDYTLFGGILLACGSSLGIIFQWLIQVTKYKKNRCDVAFMSWLNILKDIDVNEFFMLMIPATLVSGMVPIASITDFYFASFIPGAAAALSYAYLLAMAPLGIISSAIVLPLVPTFSKLTKPSSWTSLMKNLEEAILLCMVIALPLTSTMCVLAKPIVSIVFQRFTFDSAVTTLVSTLLPCYSIGSPFYIIRELLVPVFYAFGDSQLPFFISTLALVSNSFLDWLFISKFCLGAQGLALATSFVHALSASLLLHLLLRKLKGLVNSTALIGPLAQLVACCVVSGITTAVTHGILQPLLSLSILRSSLSLFNYSIIFHAQSL